MTARTSKKTIRNIEILHDEGNNYGAIVEETGASYSSVRKYILAYKEGNGTKPYGSARPDPDVDVESDYEPPEQGADAPAERWDLAEPPRPGEGFVAPRTTHVLSFGRLMEVVEHGRAIIVVVGDAHEYSVLVHGDP